uniref:Uncharacterized protein n=1 Tax=Ceratitis capitata TaxID=7213 RepID=W8C4Q3_CERCA
MVKIVCVSTRNHATLKEPKSCTTQVRNASRPTDAVTFAIGKLNLGSVITSAAVSIKLKSVLWHININMNNKLAAGCFTSFVKCVARIDGIAFILLLSQIFIYNYAH